MATYDKTPAQVIIDHQAVAHPGTVISDPINVAGKIAIAFHLYHASVEAVANANPGIFLIQSSPVDDDNEDWTTIGTFTPPATTSDTQTLTNTETAGTTVIRVSATTGFVLGDRVYIQDTGEVTDGEWGYAKSIASGVSINLIDGLKTQKDSADKIWNDAYVQFAVYLLEAIARMRVVFTHENATGPDVHIKVLAVICNSIG